MPSGVYIRTDDYKKARSLSQQQLWDISGYREHMIESHEGKTWEDLHGIEGALKLKKNLSLYQTNLLKDPIIKKNRIDLMRASQTEEVIKKKVLIATTLWGNPSYVQKQMISRNISPNNPEKLLIKLLDDILPGSYRFVGDFKYMIGGRNPDFININGQKKIIEHFGDFHHGEERTGLSREQEEKQRVNHFKKYGYDTLIIWEHELGDIKTLKVRVLAFNDIK